MLSLSGCVARILTGWALILTKCALKDAAAARDEVRDAEAPLGVALKQALHSPLEHAEPPQHGPRPLRPGLPRQRLLAENACNHLHLQRCSRCCGGTGDSHRFLTI